MKDELSRKIMTEFAGLRTETNNCLTEDSDEDKKQKTQKGVPQKENLNLKIMNILQKQLNLGKKKKQLGTSW